MSLALWGRSLPHLRRATRGKPLPWRRAWAVAVLAWGVSRLVLFVVTWVGALLLQSAHPQGTPTPIVTVSAAYVFSRWTLWDGNTYLAIAAGGYRRPILAAFFPLYPLLVHLVERVPGIGQSHALVAGLVVSNAAALGAFLALALLGLSGFRFALSAERAVWALAAYPLALFLAATYTDGLFVALACAVLLAARRRAWLWVQLWLALAALTRPTAIALVLPVLWEYGRLEAWPVLAPIGRQVWQRVGELVRTRRVPRVGRARVGRTAGVIVVQTVAWTGAVSGYLLGIGAFMLVLRASPLHDPLAFIHAQHFFSIVPRWPWQTVAEVWREWRTLPPGGWQQVRVLADVLPVALLAVVTAAGVLGRPISFTLYLVGVLALILSAPIIGAHFPDPLAGGGRFVLAAVPLWLDLGRWSVRWPLVERLWMPLGWAVQALLVVFVTTGGWLI